MCCRTIIRPFDRAIAEAVLTTGLFSPDYLASGGYIRWVRRLIEEGTAVYADLTGGDELSLSIQPVISSYEHHFGKRLAVGVCFEIAAKYAEKVGGEIYQLSNIGLCKADGLDRHLLASYPSMPLQFSQICPGFKAELLRGVEEMLGQ